jgi:hypothetical protein
MFALTCVEADRGRRWSAKAASSQNSPVPELSSQYRTTARSSVMLIVEQSNSRRLVMTKHLLNCSVRIAAAVLYLGAMTCSATAGSFTRSCAAHDLQILMLIEEKENTGAIAAERLKDAMITMMDARMLCHDGHEADALTMYDRIADSLADSSKEHCSQC